MSIIVEFEATPEKCLYDSENFKIYGCCVDTDTYPEIKLGKYSTATIKGDIQELNIGSKYIIKAEEVEDKYGFSYKVRNIHSDKPMDFQSSMNFLQEILTYNQAQTLLSVYPNIIDKIINNDLDDIDLNKTKGIKEYTFEKIKDKVISNFKLAEIVDEFSGLFSFAIIKKLYETYTSVEKIKENLHKKPYNCLCGLGGIGFKTADTLLLGINEKSKENISKGEPPILDFDFDLLTSYQRMNACAIYVLDENENNGNTYMDLKAFQKECLLYAKEAKEHLVEVIKNNESIFFDKNSLRISKKRTYDTEQYIASRLIDGIRECTNVWNFNIEKYRNIDGSDLTDDQMKTLEYVCKNNITILQGNAGSGKSFSTKALINMLRANNKSALLLAPTGRASKVLKGYTNHEASTIHRGLGFIPPAEWNYNTENPVKDDIVILDETSMTDVFLFKRLLEAIDFNRTKLLMIGDDAQLPSVSCGNLLYDLLESNVIPTVRLTKVFRYGAGGLSTVATDIRNSKNTFSTSQKGLQIIGDDKGVAYMPVIQEKGIGYILKLYQKLLEKGVNMNDILIITSQNKGDYGTQVINQEIQSAVNPKRDKYLKYGDTEYRLNDPVIQCINNYKSLLYINNTWKKDRTTFISNGEIGRVIDIVSNGLVVNFDGAKIYIPKDQMQMIKLAYAISCHRSQGGQAKYIILFAPKAHTYMLNSNLLYVGVTRAKERCYLIGELNTFARAIKKKENFNRKTWLKDLLRS